MHGEKAKYKLPKNVMCCLHVLEADIMPTILPPAMGK